LIVEVCCENIESTIIASKYGADRIELCSSLAIGGLTPTAATIQILKNFIPTPIMVLIRPRAGDFTYTAFEKKLMLQEIEQSLEAGAAGIVVGALNEHNEIDIPFMKKIKAIGKDCKTTFHRAFDFVANPKAALKKLIDLGFDSVLTSGGKSTAIKGKENLKDCIKWANNNIQIMPGAGINSYNVKELIDYVSPNEIHFSAKKIISKTTDSSPFNIDYFLTDKEELKKIKSIIDAKR